MSKATDEHVSKSIMLDFGEGGDPFNAITVKTDEIAAEESSTEETEAEVEETQETSEEETQEENTEETSQEETEESEEEESTESTEEETEESTQEQESTDEDLNLYYYIADELKSDGFLPTEFEVGENIDGVALKEQIKKNLREELEPQIKSEYDQELSTQGYQQEDLIIARALRQGVDPRLLSTASMYETYSKLADDIDEAQKEDVIKHMYQSRGFLADEIQNMVTIAQENDNIDKLFKDSRDFFGTKYNEFVEQQNQQNEVIKQQAEANVKQVNDTINRIISEKKIRGVDISSDQLKQFEDAIRKTTEVIDVNGQKYRASEVQKFLYEFETDTEVKLLSFFLHKFRDSQKEQLKKEAKKEVESEFLDTYKKRVVKKKKASTSAKAAKKKLDDAKKGTQNTYFLDFSKQGKM